MKEKLMYKMFLSFANVNLNLLDRSFKSKDKDSTRFGKFVNMSSELVPQSVW